MKKLIPNKEKGSLIVVSGPSGVGKGTILNELMKQNGDLFFSVSATTRAPRKGEIDGVSYYFYSEENFLKSIRNNEMLEYAKYSGNYYGTPSSAVKRMLEAGKDVVLEIDVQGALQVKKKMPEAVLIIVLPPSESELEHRLRSRATESEEIISSRLSAAAGEMAQADKYDYIIINDDLSEAVDRLEKIIKNIKYQ